MATSDELLSALENIAIDYDKSPANDDLPFAEAMPKEKKI